MARTDLALFDQAIHALAEAKTLEEVERIRDEAEALRTLAKRQKSLEAQNRAAGIKLRAERKLGEMLLAMPKNRGTAGQLAGKDLSGGFVMEPPEDDTPTYASKDIAKAQAFRWQLESQLPESVFLEWEAETMVAGDELTSTRLVQLATEYLRRQQHKTSRPAPPEGIYRCIVIDPPWPMQTIQRDERDMQGTGALDYRVMTLEEIGELPLREIADPAGCHLYLWVTHKFLPAGLKLMEDWGFKYQCVMTWVKPTGMTPFSWMYNTEHVLFGSRGDAPLERLGLKLAFDAPVMGHSVKPDVFYERVLAASPEPRLEMFARRDREGFTLWGDEAPTDAA